LGEMVLQNQNRKRVGDFILFFVVKVINVFSALGEEERNRQGWEGAGEEQKGEGISAYPLL